MTKFSLLTSKLIRYTNSGELFTCFTIESITNVLYVYIHILCTYIMYSTVLYMQSYSDSITVYTTP